MDPEGVRLPPKPMYQHPTAVFKSTQLDLTPEKKSTKPMPNRFKQLNGHKSSTVPTEDKLEESKIYAW